MQEQSNKMNEKYITLNNGVNIPVIGNGPGILGYTSKFNPSQPSLFRRIYNRFYYRKHLANQYINAVAHSFRIGFKLLDYSAAYGDGHLIGEAIKRSGVERKNLFLTTRISNSDQRNNTVRESLFRQLEGFGTEYIDLFMFHWPVTGHYERAWEEIVKLYKEGYCRAIGVANCHQHHIERLLTISDVVPAVNQIEVHPLFTQKELISYCWSKNITVEAYTAIARFDDRLMRLPLLKKIAAKYNKTIVQVVLRWHIQTGVIPLVRSLNSERQLENINIFDFQLTDEEMQAIDGININSRLRYDPDNCDFSIL